MPFNDQSLPLPLNDSWRSLLRSFLNDTLEAGLSALSARVSTAEQKLTTLSPKPAQGWTWADLSPELRAMLVTTTAAPTAAPTGTGLHFWKGDTDPGAEADKVPSVWPGDVA